MMMIEKLKTLDDRVAAAEARVRELEAERAKVSRAHERALGPIRDYHRAIGAGEIEPDADVEARLEAELERATRSLSRRPVLTGGEVTDWTTVDERVEAQAEGARDALEAARAERESFLHQHRGELIAERMPVALDAARELAERHEATRSAGGAYREATRELHRLGFDGELPPEPALDRRAVAALRRFAEGEPEIG